MAGRVPAAPPPVAAGRGGVRRAWTTRFGISHTPSVGGDRSGERSRPFRRDRGGRCLSRIGGRAPVSLSSGGVACPRWAAPPGFVLRRSAPTSRDRRELCPARSLSGTSSTTGRTNGRPASPCRFATSRKAGPANVLIRSSGAIARRQPASRSWRRSRARGRHVPSAAKTGGGIPHAEDRVRGVGLHRRVQLPRDGTHTCRCHGRGGPRRESAKRSAGFAHR